MPSLASLLSSSSSSSSSSSRKENTTQKGPLHLMEERLVQPAKHLAQQAIELQQGRWEVLQNKTVRRPNDHDRAPWRLLPFTEDPIKQASLFFQSRASSGATTARKNRKKKPLPVVKAAPVSAQPPALPTLHVVPATHSQALAHNLMGIEETIGLVAILLIIAAASLAAFMVHRSSKDAVTTKTAEDSTYAGSLSKGDTTPNGQTALATGGTARHSKTSSSRRRSANSRRHSQGLPPVQSISITSLDDSLSHTSQGMSLQECQALASRMKLSSQKNHNSQANLLSLRASRALVKQQQHHHDHRRYESPEELEAYRQIVYAQWGIPQTASPLSEEEEYVEEERHAIVTKKQISLALPPLMAMPRDSLLDSILQECEREGEETENGRVCEGEEAHMANTDGSCSLASAFLETDTKNDAGRDDGSSLTNDNKAFSPKAANAAFDDDNANDDSSIADQDRQHDRVVAVFRSTSQSSQRASRIRNNSARIISPESVEEAYSMCLSVSTNNETSNNDIESDGIDFDGMDITEGNDDDDAPLRRKTRLPPQLPFSSTRRRVQRRVSFQEARTNPVPRRRRLSLPDDTCTGIQEIVVSSSLEQSRSARRSPTPTQESNALPWCDTKDTKETDPVSDLPALTLSSCGSSEYDERAQEEDLATLQRYLHPLLGTPLSYDGDKNDKAAKERPLPVDVTTVLAMAATIAPKTTERTGAGADAKSKMDFLRSSDDTPVDEKHHEGRDSDQRVHYTANCRPDRIQSTILAKDKTNDAEFLDCIETKKALLELPIFSGSRLSLRASIIKAASPRYFDSYQEAPEVQEKPGIDKIAFLSPSIPENDQCCLDRDQRRKLQNSRLLIRVVLGADRKDYKTTAACFEALDRVVAFRREVHQAVKEMARGQQLLLGIKECWYNLGDGDNAGGFSLPDFCVQESDDLYEKTGYAFLQICTLLHPNTNIGTEEDACITFQKLLSKGSIEDMTLVVGSVSGITVSLSLCGVDSEQATRTRLTPYECDKEYPLSLQDALRVVRSIMGPALHQVSNNDCLRAIQVYGLLHIQYRQLTKQLREQRLFVEELHSVLALLAVSLRESYNERSPEEARSVFLSALRLEPCSSFDSCRRSIFSQATRIHQLLSEKRL